MIFSYFEDEYCSSYGEFALFEFKMHAASAPAAVANIEMWVSPLYYDRGQQAAHSAGLWDAKSIIFNSGRSVASWTLCG